MEHNRGYIFLWRGWLDHPVLSKGAGPFTRREALAWLIEHAAWREQDGLQRGQLRITIRFLASAWKWPRMSVVRFLDELSGTNMLKNGQQNGTKKTLITLCNYEKYQGSWDNFGTGFGTNPPEKWDTRIKTEESSPPFRAPKGALVSPPSLRSEGESAHQVLKSEKSRKGGRVNGHRLSPAEKLFAGFAAAAGYDSLAGGPAAEPLLDPGRPSGNPSRPGRRLDC